jgi:tetratricopeptide (TPR) repeat protein
MEALAAKYPDDVEAKIFWALALNETFDHKSMEPLLKAIMLLEPIDQKYPDHPGVTHYLIHSYDFAPIAKGGIPAADKYATIAPSSPHAVHMPSHIYSMVGMWDASIRSNQRAAVIAQEFVDRNFPGAVYHAVLHSADFMQYAYLQLGEDREAAKIVDHANATIKAKPKVVGVPIVAYTAMAAIPARYALERQDWRAAAALEPPTGPFPQAEAITYFARALGAARSGALASAPQEIDKLKQQRAALEKAGQPYWAGQVEVQILGAQAWLAQSQGNKDEALKLMRAAADLEDASAKHVAMENRLYPMRELLGDMLMAQQAPVRALKEYEESMKAMPNRLRGFYGAAKAAAAAGDPQKAAVYFDKLAQLTRASDADRPEIRESRQRVAAR